MLNRSSLCASVVMTLAASLAACSSASTPGGDGAEADALTGTTTAATPSTSSAAATATTTRTALTANDTSASSLFRDEYTPAARFFGADIKVVTNGDNPAAATTAATLADGAISKVSLHTLLPANPAAKIFFETQSWFCTNATSSTTALSSALNADQCGSHLDIGYANNSTAQASKQVADMQSRGADGLLLDWQGPGGTLVQNQHTTDVTEINDGALFAFKTAAEATKNFSFAVVEDEAAKASSKANGGDWTKGIIADLTYLSEKLFPSPAYYRSKGQPVVFFFGVDHYASVAGSSIDWAAVHEALPGVLFVFENTGHTLADGDYAWPSPTPIGSYPGSDPFDVASYLPYFYKEAAATAVKLTYGMAYKGFDDHAVNGWVSTSSSSTYENGRRYSGQQCGKTWLDSFSSANAHAGALEAVQLPTWDDYEEATELESGIDNHLAVSAKVSGSTLSWTLAAERGAPEDCTDAISKGFDLADTVHHFAVYASPAGDGEKLTLVADDLSPATRSLDLTGKLAAGSWVLSVRAVAQPSITNKLSTAVAYTSAGGGGTDAGAGCSGVPTILEPLASENVGPAIELRVTAPACIETMIAYLDGKPVATIAGNTTDQWISVSPGAHVINVNGWAGTDEAHTSAHVAFTRTY
jgi:hypothetical protein